MEYNNDFIIEYNIPSNSTSKKKLIEICKNLSQMEYIEIFNIIKNDGCSYTENTNGVFINLSNVNEGTINKIFNFLNYIKNNNTNLVKHEEIIEDVKKNINYDINYDIHNSVNNSSIDSSNYTSNNSSNQYINNLNNQIIPNNNLYENNIEFDEDNLYTDNNNNNNNNNYLNLSSDDDDNVNNKISLKKKKTKYSGKKAKIMKSLKDNTSQSEM
jgi:hypothetical protein